MTLTTEISNGGLGMVDPDNQCKALLAKFVVRAMLPAKGIWSELLLNRLVDTKPCIGGIMETISKMGILIKF